MDGLALTNKNQEVLTNEINTQLQDYIAKAKKSKTSSTFVPQYDSMLSDQDKKEIVDVELSPRVADRVKK